MSKKTIYITIIAVILVVFSLLVFFTKSTVSYPQSDILGSVPNNTALFVKINNPAALLSAESETNMFETLLTIPSFSEFNVQLNELKQFASQNTDCTRLLKSDDILLTFNYSGRDEVNPMLLIALKAKSENDAAQNLFNILKTEENAFTRKYNKVNIAECTFNKATVAMAISNGVLIVSNNSIMIEEAIMQQDTEPIDTDLELEKLMKTMSKQADLNLFVNHNHAERLLKKWTAAHLSKQITLASKYTRWTELDINIQSDKILAGGFSANEDANSYFANIIKKQKATASQIDKVLPHFTSFFVSLTLSSLPDFFNDYQDYLSKKDRFYQHKESLLKIEKETGIKVHDLFIELMAQETALASVIADQANPHSGRIWIIDTKSGSTAISKIIDLQNKYIQNKAIDGKEWTNTYTVDNQTNFAIYKFPYPNLPQLLFGQLFSGVEANWFTVYNNFLIFGDSFRTVSRTLHANLLGETLSASLEYNQHKTNFNARSNITFYGNISVALPIAGALFNKSIAAQLSNNDELRKFKSFGWQISSTGDLLYNNIFLTHSTNIKSKPQTVWQSHIEAGFNFKPKFVMNHNDPQNKEVIVQDKNNNFILINNIGRVIWQIKLDGPILGEVHQIDYFKNGKYQYLFNTENKLYMIDRNGNNVKNFPLNFRSKATNGVAVFDYENNKDYRYFVACDDRNIYAYNNHGNLLDGWQLFKTDHEVSKPLQHFRVEGKDFIVATDNMKDYLLHRRGTIRVQTSEVYPHSVNNTIYLEERTANNEPRLVTTDTNGNLRYTYFDGKHETLSHNLTLSENHWMVLDNVNNNQQYQYIFADEKQLLIVDSKGKTLLMKQLDNDITHRPNIYNFSQNTKKIGITNAGANKIYLLNSNGEIHPGFPLAGCTEFSIGFLSSELSNFNLLVGSPDGYLYNYYVE